MERDILRLEGVKAKGYGIVAKIVMQDEDIPAQAKALYALITSFASNGNTYMPSRDKLIYWLCISKNTYYKYLNELKVAGLITVEQQVKSRYVFGANIYTIKECPAKYINIEKNEEYNKVKIAGINGLGYGIIPKIPMQDSRLNVYSKAIYAYFCSISGIDVEITIKIEKLAKHLCINVQTITKYIKELVETKYILRKKHSGGKFKSSTFILNQFLDVDCNTVEKDTYTDCDTAEGDTYTDCDTVEGDTYTDCDTVEEDAYTDCDTAEKDAYTDCDTVDQDTYNNNIYINKYINSLSLSKDNKIKNIMTELKFNRGIPYDYKVDKENMTTAIHFLTDWDSFFPNGFFKKSKQQLYELINETLIDMCCTAMQVLKGKDISYANVIDKINIISKGEKCGLWVFVNDSMRLFKDAIRGKNIKNYSGYMRSFLWDYLSTYCIEKENILGDI